MSALEAALRRDRPSTREEFLAFMAKRYNWTRGAELGLWYGRTFFHLLKNCPDLHMIGVDVFDPQPDNADHSSEAVRQDILDWSPKVKDTGWITGHDIDWPTVKSVVGELVPGYKTGPDNVWYRTKKV